MFPNDMTGVINSMQQVYYKLKDIEADIEMYRKMLRHNCAGTSDRQAISKEIAYLKGKAEKLLEANRGNRAFTCDGIPMHHTRKHKPESAKRCPKLEQFLQDQKTEKDKKLIEQNK
jgi:predicted methyltransferase